MNKYVKELTDPTKNQEPISLEGLDTDLLKKFFRSMTLIRKAEQKLAVGKREGLIGGPVHLGVGQEAIAVGVAETLVKTDRVFGGHRSHSHLLSLNPDCFKLFSEVLGKASGFSKGMGGSMHLFDGKNGFYGSVPIVAGTVSLAVGAAMAARLQRTQNVSVAYLGDGAIEEGVVHEALNLAKMQSSPILFVIENNLFASHMHISLRQPRELCSRYAEASRIPFSVIDGNDVVSIYTTAKQMVREMREQGGPRFLELITYRWYGHVDWREDIDVGVKRSLEDTENWKARDPIARLSASMNAATILDEREMEEIEADVQEIVDLAWVQAIKAAPPAEDATMNYVYSGVARKGADA